MKRRARPLPGPLPEGEGERHRAFTSPAGGRTSIPLTGGRTSISPPPGGIKGGNTHRRHALYFAFWLHRVSGLLLVLFLPLHFWVLGSAILGAEALDGYLVLTDHPAAKAAEFGLVFLLAMHLFGGLRIMALEFLTWRAAHKTVAAAAIAAAFAVACGFLLRAF